MNQGKMQTLMTDDSVSVRKCKLKYLACAWPFHVLEKALGKRSTKKLIFQNLVPLSNI